MSGAVAAHFGEAAPRRAIRGVVFDKDGTLFDFHATWGVWSRGLIEAESGGDAALAGRIAEVLGYDLAAHRFRPESPVIASTTATVAALLRPVLPGEPPLEEVIARLDARTSACPQVEAAPLRELLGRLRGMGLALGVATNDSEAPARAHLGHVLDLLDFVAGYDSGWGGKPAAGQLLAFAADRGLEPGDCAMVGDSLHDLAAARAAGMVAVGVLTGLAGRETLGPVADVVLESVAALPDWIAARG